MERPWGNLLGTEGARSWSRYGLSAWGMTETTKALDAFLEN